LSRGRTSNRLYVVGAEPAEREEFAPAEQRTLGSLAEVVEALGDSRAQRMALDVGGTGAQRQRVPARPAGAVRQSDRRMQVLLRELASWSEELDTLLASTAGQPASPRVTQRVDLLSSRVDELRTQVEAQLAVELDPVAAVSAGPQQVRAPRMVRQGQERGWELSR
jgi:hypothetical protein